jgi:transposase
VWADQAYNGDLAAWLRAVYGIDLEVVERAPDQQGFTVLPRRWVVERSFGWAARFRRLAWDYERLPETLIGLHFLAFAILMAKRVVETMLIVHNTLLL